MDYNFENIELLGLTKSEVSIYTSLCETGKAAAQLIAKRTSKKRTTVYSCLDSLINKGLVTIEKGRTTSIFSANAPSSILANIETEKLFLQKKERAAQDFVKQISSLLESQRKNIPKIKYVEGREGVSNFLTANLKLWESSIAEYDSIWWGYQDHTFVEEYRTWLSAYWSNKPDNVRILLFSNESITEKLLANKVRGREIKSIPANADFTSTIWVCGDYIIMIVARDRPHYAVQIYDEMFSANLRMIFKSFW